MVWRVSNFLLAKGKGFGVRETNDGKEEGRRIGIRRKGGRVMCFLSL